MLNGTKKSGGGSFFRAIRSSLLYNRKSVSKSNGESFILNYFLKSQNYELIDFFLNSFRRVVRIFFESQKTKESVFLCIPYGCWIIGQKL